MLAAIAAYTLIVAFAISYMLSYYLLKNRDKFHIGKRVYSERVRLHKGGIPRLGGLAIYVALFVTILFSYFLDREDMQRYAAKLLGIFLASAIIAVCGLYDDLVKRLSYKIKFTMQIIAVSVVIAFGYRITVASNPFGGTINIGLLGIPLVILWMLAIMNAINLIDGLDGLACGVSLIVCFSFMLVGLYKQNLFLTVLSAGFIGSCLAFLKYNFYPAKLFLGDSGSFFLGFMLGILAIESNTKRTTAVSLVIPLLTLFVPIGSVIFTFSRRLKAGKNPFRPDRMHMHYRFLHAGLSHQNTVFIYYILTLLYVILGGLCFLMPKKFELAIIIFAAFLIWCLYIWAVRFISTRRKLRRKRR